MKAVHARRSRSITATSRMRDRYFARNAKSKPGRTSSERLFTPSKLDFGKHKGELITTLTEKYLWWIRSTFDRRNIWWKRAGSELVIRGYELGKRARKGTRYRKLAKCQSV